VQRAVMAHLEQEEAVARTVLPLERRELQARAVAVVISPRPVVRDLRRRLPHGLMEDLSLVLEAGVADQVTAEAQATAVFTGAEAEPQKERPVGSSGNYRHHLLRPVAEYDDIWTTQFISRQVTG
jgi:hypothetical protein